MGQQAASSPRVMIGGPAGHTLGDPAALPAPSVTTGAMLKQALASAKGGAAPPQPQADAKLDGQSFPCCSTVMEGQPLLDDELAADVESKLRLHRQSSLAGSMPRGYRNSVSRGGVGGDRNHARRPCSSSGSAAAGALARLAPNPAPPLVTCAPVLPAGGL